MSWLSPAPTPYDPLAWERLPIGERGRIACQAWALDGYGAPLAAYGFYIIKIGLYVGGWLGFCALTPTLGGPATIATWWDHPLAFQKAIVWSMLFEGLGLGCGSGPLTGRYTPPVGGFLYFLRPGTTKAAAWPDLPLLGGLRRTWLDVGLYAALLVALVHALLAPALGAPTLLPVLALVAVFAISDRSIFLALRSEHYATTLVCFVATAHWLGPAKAVQLALWFWAGVSKLNRHFPTVVCVMTSNSPVARWPALRRRMYRAYPDDLRPSRLAVTMAHAGTALELGVPLVLAFATDGTPLLIGLIMMVSLHAFITSNVPMGVPLEWNVMVVYGAFVLFGSHAEVPFHAVEPTWLAVFLLVVLVGLPLFGNLWPRHLSFLLSMRYYAGNWPYSVWLFRGDSYRKLDRLTKTSPWIHDQLARFYDRATVVGMFGRILAFRMMHLQGRALPVLVPRAVEHLADHTYVDGELIAGMALGWNFGDGHLHHEPLVAALQAQCGWGPGELRCIFVESQPLGRPTMAYRIVDAATGLVEAGELDVRELRRRQPWEST